MKTKTWSKAACDGFVTGGAAAATSVAMLAACGERDNGSAVAPVNAVSHVIWGDAALHENRMTAAHTLPGLLIHVGSALAWGVLYEKLFGRRERSASLARTACDAAIATAGIAVVDLQLVPDRLTPGFERRLSPNGLLLVYAALGVGLAVGTRLANRGS